MNSAALFAMGALLYGLPASIRRPFGNGLTGIEASCRPASLTPYE
jgi:hypothetical protein